MTDDTDVMVTAAAVVVADALRQGLLTPEDIGLVRVNSSHHLNWPWYRLPDEWIEPDPVHGVRDVPAPVRDGDD